MSLECTYLIWFFTPRLFSVSEVRNGKPAPDLYRRVCAVTGVPPGDCVVVEDSAGGVAAGMTAIVFLGGSHCDIRLAAQLGAAGARRHLEHAGPQKHLHRFARLVINPIAFRPVSV